MRRWIWILLIWIGTPGLAQLPKSAYVVNTLGESLSVIDLQNQTVISDAVTLGLFTNFVTVSNTEIFVVNSGDNAVQVIDLFDYNSQRQIDVGSGTNPWAIELISPELAAVSLLLTNQVVFVALPSGDIVETVTVGTGPEGMAVSRGYLYVANSGFNGAGFDPGQVSAIRLSDYAVTQIPVGTNPQAVAADAEGNIVVVCSGDFFDPAVNGEIDLIDPATQTVSDSLKLDPALTNVVVSASNMAYLATFGSGVLVYDLVNRSFIRDENNPLPGGPGLAVDAQDNVYITDFNTDSVYVYSPTHQRVAGYLVGDGPLSIAVHEGIVNAIDPSATPVPRTFLLGQNYPNPFNPSTRIGVEVRQPGRYRLEVRDAGGRLVATLVHGFLSAGHHEIIWNGHTEKGRPAASGLYLYRLIFQNQTQVRKMLLVR